MVAIYHVANINIGRLYLELKLIIILPVLVVEHGSLKSLSDIWTYKNSPEDHL